jgi:hypothetical protein
MEDFVRAITNYGEDSRLFKTILYLILMHLRMQNSNLAYLRWREKFE